MVNNTSLVWGDDTTRFFFELTPDRVLDAIERTGLKCTGRLVALNSLENRVYEVEVEVDRQGEQKNSDRFRVVKFYRPGRWSKEQILEEHEFIFDLAEREIPVVAPTRFADGTSLGTLPDIQVHFAIFPKQGGRMLDELESSQLTQIGRLIARMHNVGEIKTAQHRIAISPETFGRDNLDLLFDAEIIPEPLEQRYEQIVEDICEISTPWFAQAPVQRIHGDCHLGNLLWGSDGVFLVDFDDMLRGPCVQDLWLLVQGRDEESLRRREIILGGYQEMRAFPHETLRLVEPLRALRMVNFTLWIAKRWNDPVFPKIFPEYGSDKYWQEEIQALSEIREILHGVQ